MLKLIIADDERIIRETISNLIDWKAFGIEVIGLCKNGLETYDMIMDEDPDIVLTDIRMPGMDGLELIRRVRSMKLDTQFIILSGYGEFEYAKQAMKNGVRHYLLKPCNEAQILECIRECQKDCQARRNTERIVSERFLAAGSMAHNVIFSAINDSICQNRGFEEILAAYESYLDFTFTPYRLYYVYFLSFESLEDFLGELRPFWENHVGSVIIHGIYVNNTLLLFFQDFAPSYPELERFLAGRTYPGQSVYPEIEGLSYPSLSQLLPAVLERIRRFGMIYYINNFRLLYTCSYNARVNELERLSQEVLDRRPEALEQLTELILAIGDLTFFRQIASNLFMKLALNRQTLSSAALTEHLLRIENEEDLTALKNVVIDRLRQLMEEPASQPLSAMTRQIQEYVDQNLQDDNLTLKYIAQNFLFMNVDYVSKKFLKETGVKFSTYLSDVRIRKAKELLAAGGDETIQDIAEAVGLGNNPRYFSQLFKKKTGMTPSAWVGKITGRVPPA